MKYQTYLKNLRRSVRVDPEHEVVVIDDDCDLDLGFLVDLSLRGMRIAGTRPIPRDRCLNYRLEITTSEESCALVIAGTCVWCRGVAGTDEYESGVAFDFVTGQVRERLKSMLAAISQA